MALAVSKTSEETDLLFLAFSGFSEEIKTHSNSSLIFLSN